MKLRKPSRAVLAGVLLWLALAACALAETGTPIPPAPQRWLTDTAGFLSPAVADELDVRLENYERSSGRQFIVYIGSSSGDMPLEDWSIKTLESWKVGKKGLDEGLVLFIMAADKRMRIEVGYGLEEVLPDALAGRVINDELVPRLQNGDNDGAVRAGVERLIAIISGDQAAAGGSSGSTENEPRKGPPMTLFEKVLIGIAVLFFLILLITNPSLALYLLFTILSGGRGGGGGGRGGFSGGGGRFGGGGASGSW